MQVLENIIRVKDEDKTTILMVAPPDKEPLDQFLFLAKSLERQGL